MGIRYSEGEMKAFWLILIPVLLAGCASGRGGSDYERVETRRAYEVRMGEVVSVRSVKIEGTESGVGAASGGVIGGIAGSTAGRGRGSMVGAVLGAVVGGIAGAATEEAVTRENGVEVII